MRVIRHKWILRPSIDYLYSFDRLMIDANEMAQFLNVPVGILKQMVGSDRIPLPFKLGLGKCSRWSVFELLEWVEAGCPKRGKWIEMRGRSGWYPTHRWRWV